MNMSRSKSMRRSFSIRMEHDVLPEMVHSCNSIAQFQRTEVKRGLQKIKVNMYT